jgi:hypothetical protein
MLYFCVPHSQFFVPFHRHVPIKQKEGREKKEWKIVVRKLRGSIVVD